MSVHDYVSEDRLRTNIETTAEFGTISGEGRGRTALTATEPNRKAREYLVEQLHEAQLDVRIDAVGNIAGRWVPDGADPDASPVVTGSHLDSVPQGGIFDGVLGVYAALESVRAMQAADIDLVRPVNVVSFTGEEGTRFEGVLGSSVAVGERSVEDALALTDSDGITLEETLTDIDFHGEGSLDASEWDSWLEVHIEQSERLENADITAGIVTDITGMVRCHVTIEGEANHAGTTSMGDRTDALSAASELVLAVEEATRDVVAADSETAVGTVGDFNVSPSAVNVIAGEINLSLDIRDIERASMEHIIERARKTLARLKQECGIETSFKRSYDIDPVPMSEKCMAALQRGADRAGIETMELHSGAGHDTMHVATVTDAGMVFSPSQDGISHSPREWTDWEDCAAATRVLAEAIVDQGTN
jgi:N-carbamoyl-L-amino-acid hydrolase